MKDKNQKLPMKTHKASLLAVFGVSVVVLILSAGTMQGFQPERQPVSGPKAIDALRHTLRINGNRNVDEVIFNHEEHRERLSDDSGCSICHHVYRPGDVYSACFTCHSDMKLGTPIFSHSGHEEKLGKNDSCAQCHDLALVKSRETVKDCRECHARDMGMTASEKGERFNEMAPGYESAMHDLCLNCHREQASKVGRPELPDCDTCHRKVHHEDGELER